MRTGQSCRLDWEVKKDPQRKPVQTVPKKTKCAWFDLRESNLIQRIPFYHSI